MRKTKASWRMIGDIKKYYRSAWEANFARYLQWLKINKKILQWHHEPETFWFEGIKRGVTSYKPDFRVKELSGDLTYYEVKGFMDAKSLTKIKRMKKYHPNIKLIVIDAKSYRELTAKISKIIIGWE